MATFFPTVQDQLERQVRETYFISRESMRLNRDVDRRMDSLRGETDRQFRDCDWPGEQFMERYRDTFECPFQAFDAPGRWPVAMIIGLVIAIVASPERRRSEPAEPERRSHVADHRYHGKEASEARMDGLGFRLLAGTAENRQLRSSGSINGTRATMPEVAGPNFGSTAFRRPWFAGSKLDKGVDSGAKRGGDELGPRLESRSRV